MTSARNEASPVAGSEDSPLRRLGEQVRAIIASDEFLSRLKVGPIVRAATGAAASLAWGQQNRVDGSGVLQLPPMEPKWIGKPLVMSKMTGTGIATVKASGNPAPLIDGSPSGIQVTAAGARTFYTDGSNWYSDVQASVASTVAAFSGTGIGEIGLHDTTYSPVGLWQFQDTLADSSGNGFDVTVDAGTLSFMPLAQRMRGVRLDGLRLTRPYTTLLAIKGDMTIEMMSVLEKSDGGGVVIAYTGGADDTSSIYNYQYQISVNTGIGITPGSRGVSWLSEHGVGVNDLYVPTMLALPPPGEPFHFATSRINNKAQMYLNGKPFGTLSPTLLTPTDGSVAALFIGGTGRASGLTSPVDTVAGMCVTSLKIVPTGLDAAAVKSEYARTLGPFLGTNF